MHHRQGDVQLPPWLRAAAQAKRRKTHFINLGLSTLVDALACDIAHLGASPSASDGVAWERLESKASGLLANLAITRQAILGSNDDYMDALGERVGGRLEEFRDGWSEWANRESAEEPGGKKNRTAGINRPTTDDRGRASPQLKRHAPTFVRYLAPHMRLHVLSVSAAWVRSGAAEARLLQLDSTQAARSLHRVAAAVAAAHRFGDRSVSANFAEAPDDVGRACWAVLNSRLDSSRSARIDALALLGALVREVSETRRCAVCFRWSMPGRAHCRSHSLAASHGSSRTERQARYEASKRILVRLFGMDAVDARPRLGENQKSADWMRHLLWPKVDATGEEDLVKLMAHLNAQPELCAYLNLDQSALIEATILRELQVKVDPLETRPHRWRSILEVADLWRRCEVHKGERTTGFRPATIESIEAAIHIASSREKALTQAELAIALGVSPSAISKRLRRGAGLACVEALRELLGSGADQAARRLRPENPS